MIIKKQKAYREPLFSESSEDPPTSELVANPSQLPEGGSENPLEPSPDGEALFSQQLKTFT